MPTIITAKDYVYYRRPGESPTLRQSAVSVRLPSDDLYSPSGVAVSAANWVPLDTADVGVAPGTGTGSGDAAPPVYVWLKNDAPYNALNPIPNPAKAVGIRFVEDPAPAPVPSAGPHTTVSPGDSTRVRTGPGVRVYVKATGPGVTMSYSVYPG